MISLPFNRRHLSYDVCLGIKKEDSHFVHAVKLSFRGSTFLVASLHPRDMPTRVASSRGCYEDATRKLLPWNFSFAVLVMYTVYDSCSQ